MGGVEGGSRFAITENLYRPQRSCGKVIFTARKRSLGQGNIFAPVCHSVYRGGVPDTTQSPRDQVHPPLGPGTPPRPGTLPPDQVHAHAPPGPGTPPWDQVHPPGPGTHSPGPGTPPPVQSMLWDTVNMRAVRILLECNLVSQACVKNSVHGRGRGCLPQCMLGYTPRQTPPQADTSPGYGYCSGRYASYWNAFLYFQFLWTGTFRYVDFPTYLLICAFSVKYFGMNYLREALRQVCVWQVRQGLPFRKWPEPTQNQTQKRENKNSRVHGCRLWKELYAKSWLSKSRAKPFRKGAQVWSVWIQCHRHQIPQAAST